MVVYCYCRHWFYVDENYVLMTYHFIYLFIPFMFLCWKVTLYILTTNTVLVEGWNDLIIYWHAHPCWSIYCLLACIWCAWICCGTFNQTGRYISQMSLTFWSHTALDSWIEVQPKAHVRWIRYNRLLLMASMINSTLFTIWTENLMSGF